MPTALPASAPRHGTRYAAEFAAYVLPLPTAVTSVPCLRKLALQVEELSAAAAHRKVAQVCAR